MTIVQRRVFYGKAGMAAQLIELLEEANVMARGVGMAIKPRILSDYSSGRTDCVALEWEAESYQELEGVQTEFGVYPEGEELFKEFSARLHSLIEYAEVETWQVHWPCRVARPVYSRLLPIRAVVPERTPWVSRRSARKSG